jgi:hypothetical protein
MFFSRLFHNVLFYNNVFKSKHAFRLMDSPYRCLNQEWMSFWCSNHIVKGRMHEIDCPVKCSIWKIALPYFKCNSFCSVPCVWIETGGSWERVYPKFCCWKVRNWWWWQRWGVDGDRHLSGSFVLLNSTLQMTWSATQCIYVALFSVFFSMKNRLILVTYLGFPITFLSK